jgi:hypothetical protein
MFFHWETLRAAPEVSSLITVSSKGLGCMQVRAGSARSITLTFGTLPKASRSIRLHHPTTTCPRSYSPHISKIVRITLEVGLAAVVEPCMKLPSSPFRIFEAQKDATHTVRQGFIAVKTQTSRDLEVRLPDPNRSNAFPLKLVLRPEATLEGLKIYPRVQSWQALTITTTMSWSIRSGL